MEKIYSKIKPEVLLNIVYRKEDMKNQPQPGVDITPETEFIQVRSLKPENGKKFKAHKHLHLERKTTITQESIIIIEGALKARYFDIDNSPMGETILHPGDCIVTLQGGHEFDVIKEGTIMYELKNGPYMGLEKDKEPI